MVRTQPTFLYGVSSPCGQKTRPLAVASSTRVAKHLRKNLPFVAASNTNAASILADGFYEWKAGGARKAKTPYFIHMKDRKPFAFAGLWDSWNSPDGSLIRSCTIITTEPNELVSIVHNRMPVILHPRDYGKWLDPIASDSR